MSPPFVDEPTRCDLDSIVEKVDDGRQFVEIHLVDHNSKHEFNILPRLIQRGGGVSTT